MVVIIFALTSTEYSLISLNSIVDYLHLDQQNTLVSNDLSSIIGYVKMCMELMPTEKALVTLNSYMIWTIISGTGCSHKICLNMIYVHSDQQGIVFHGV